MKVGELTLDALTRGNRTGSNGDLLFFFLLLLLLFSLSLLLPQALEQGMGRGAGGRAQQRRREVEGGRDRRRHGEGELLRLGRKFWSGSLGDGHGLAGDEDELLVWC